MITPGAAKDTEMQENENIEHVNGIIAGEQNKTRITRKWKSCQ